MTATPAHPVPEIDPDACSLGRLAASGCAVCADACPRGALVLDDAGLTLDANACSACGACAAACPTQAILLDGVENPQVQSRMPAKTAALICPRKGGQMCLQALGLRALAGLWLSGLRQLATLTADCASCANGAGLKFADHLSDLNALLADRRLAPLTVVAAQNLPRNMARIGPAIGPDPARRGLFGLGANPATTKVNPLFRLQSLGQDPTARMAFSPRIDAARCTGCDACLRLCPEATLSLVKDENGEMLYRSSSFKCSGCGVCADVCSAGAMWIEPLAATPPDLPLRTLCCRGCGVTVHVPRDGPLGRAGLCPICAATGHHSRLHQVLS